MIRKNNYQLFIFAFLSLTLLKSSLTINNEIIEYFQIDDCQQNEYFDTSSLSCMECDIDKHLVPSKNRLKCECDNNSKLIGFENYFPICKPCKFGTILTSDGKDCIPCRKENSTLNCSCPLNKIKVERKLTGELLETVQCLPCFPNAYPSFDGQVCLPCNDIKFNRLTNCDCPDEFFIRLNNYCFPKNYSYWFELHNTYFVEFQNQTFESYYLKKNLQLATYLCKDENKTECEHLSNMCALTLFSNEAACNFIRLKDSSLFYKEDTISIINSKNISQKYNLDKHSNKSTIDLKVIKYSLEGEFESIDVPYIFNELLYVRFGVNIHKQQKIMTKELMERKMEFLIPYLAYNNENKVNLHSLPILVQQINENKEISQWKLVRKFFLVDSVTGRKSIKKSVNDSLKSDHELSGLRYLKSLEILIKVQSLEDHGKIFPPLFIIQYDELTKQQILNDEQVLVDVKVTFVASEQNITKIIGITVGFFAIFAVILSALKTWTYRRRNYSSEFNILLILWFLIYFLIFIANIILFVSISTCICTFIFYKGQTVLHIPLPDKIDETTIHICTIIAFCLKTIELISVLFRQWSVNLFFIDWEQPRAISSSMEYSSPRTNLKKLFSDKLNGKNGDIPKRKRRRASKSKIQTEIDISPIKKNEEQENERTIPKKTPVSVWRSFFIVNEFYKIQTNRRVSIMFQIVSTLFFLEVIGLKNWSIGIPELSINDEKRNELQKNYTLRYGIGALVYLILYLFQWLLSISIYETYVRKRIQRFIDLCSISNISLFILHFKYHGFYIHGRSVHGFADTDLETLVNDLKKEEKNLCPHRGLVPGTIEQTFIISVTPSFRKMLESSYGSEEMSEKRFLRKQYTRFLNWEKSIMAHEKVIKFLSKFIDHCFKDLDYVVKDKLFIENLCDTEFVSSRDKSVFYRDNSNSFECITFYGSEWILGTFEIALFVFSQAIFQNYVIALLITFLISHSLMIINKWNVKRNLTKNTLISKRFLV
ncbi:meckelin [Leptopilina boulardi]|uniref:meckelin n=1 Tax=Leptopilina boulardi TaxID=63433 RepID=UPI0021F6872A|nr:meckelin [Leptopilina boulardi]